MKFLQVTQLNKDIVEKIILIRNSFPLNPLLVFVGTDSYITMKKCIMLQIVIFSSFNFNI